MSTASEIFDKAADLIEPEGRWTQGRYAKDDSGHYTNPESSRAVCWCTVGALQRVAGYDLNGYFDAKNALNGLVGGSVVSWNDAPERTQAEVVAKLREAAEKAREQGL